MVFVNLQLNRLIVILQPTTINHELANDKHIMEPSILKCDGMQLDFVEYFHLV